MLLTNLSISYADEMITIYKVIPEEAAVVIQDYLEYTKQFSNSFLSPLIVISIWMSSNAIIALMKAFNVAYAIEETRNYFYRKLIAIVCTIMTLLLIIGGLVIPNIGIYVMNFIRRYMEVPEMNETFFRYFKALISLGIFVIVLGSLYFILPNKKVKFKEVIPGTIFSFLGLVIISYLFAYFVREFSRYSIVYGSLAAVIILLIWLFLCGLILMLGGEINAIKYEKMKKL